MPAYGPLTDAAAQSALAGLRPLSVGELLDRAFSICLRHLIPFAALVVVVIVPQMIFAYLGTRGIMAQFGDIFNPLTVGSQVPDPQKMFDAYARGLPYFALVFGMIVLLVPLSNAAIASGVSRAYLGMPVRFKDCYGDALPRWFSVVVLMLLWVATAIIAAIAVEIVALVLGLALSAGVVALGTTGVIIAAIFGIAAAAAILLLALELYLAAAFSFVGAVLEGTGAIAAFASGFARVFGEGQMWRSLGIAAALVGVALAFFAVRLAVSWMLAVLAHSFAVDFVVGAVFAAFTYPFTFAVVALAYYDVRIRREGFDLQMLAARLGAPAASAAAQ
jgi:hypothetical protein